jgi:hypothetical protein
MKGKEAGEAKTPAAGTAKKFISSLERFVWCEWLCHNSTSHERLVWGELMFWFPGVSGVFPAGLIDPIDVRDNLFPA